MVAPEINLRSIDLNLLTILEKLLIHKHISQAAQALNMSQPPSVEPSCVCVNNLVIHCW